MLVVFSLVGNSTVESYPSLTNPAATVQSCKFNYIIFYSLFGYKVRVCHAILYGANRLLLGLITAVHRVLVFHDLERQACNARLYGTVSLGLHIRRVWSNIDPDNVDHH